MFMDDAKTNFDFIFDFFNFPIEKKSLIRFISTAPTFFNRIVCVDPFEIENLREKHSEGCKSSNRINHRWH